MNDINPQNSQHSRWFCTVCGYVYDEAVGDDSQSVAAGTPWHQLDDTWVCPDCDMPKSDFVPADTVDLIAAL